MLETGLYLPLLDSLKAVANDDHVGQSTDRPVPPQQVVVQCLAAVHHVEQGRRSICAVLALLEGGYGAVIVWSRHGHSLVTWGWDGVLLPRSLGADATPVLPVLPAPALRRPGRRGSSAWVAPVGHRHAWDTDTHGQRYVGMGRGRYRRDGRLPPASRAAAAGRPAAAGRRGRQRTAPARNTRSARPAPSPAAPARLLRARGQPSAAARLLPPPSSPSRRRPARTGARRPEAGAQQLVPAGGNAAVSGARSGKEPRAPHSPRVPQPPQHHDSALLLLLPSLPPPPPARRAPTARRRHAAPPGRRRAALT